VVTATSRFVALPLSAVPPSAGPHGWLAASTLPRHLCRSAQAARISSRVAARAHHTPLPSTHTSIHFRERTRTPHLSHTQVTRSHPRPYGTLVVTRIRRIVTRGGYSRL
jgi:hypothetical protein